MEHFGARAHGPHSRRHRTIGILAVAALLAGPIACGPASGSLVPSISMSESASPAPTAAMTASPSPSPTSLAASAAPDSLRWVEGEAPGVPSTSDPDVTQEFHLLGWSKGYLGFTSVFSTSTGSMQRVLVTSSADGIHWNSAGRLDLGTGHTMIVVTQVVEGPAGLLATAEVGGCALHKPAVRMWRSLDGTSWTPVDLKGVFGADVLPEVSGGSAGYLVLAATGTSRTLWASLDGVSWHRKSMPSGTFSPWSLASFQAGFILAGTTRVGPLDCGATTGGPVEHYTGSVWSSQLGSPWTTANLPGVLPGTDTAMYVYRLNDATVLVVEAVTDADAPDDTLRRLAWTSSDGSTWVRDDALAVPLGLPLTDGTRTMFVTETDSGGSDVWTLTDDLGLVRHSAPADVPIESPDTLAALGPAGLLVTDADGATSWLGVPAP